MSISQNFPNTRPSLSINFARSQTLDPRITFTRTTSGTRVGPDGYIEVIPADQPRFDFDPVTGECLGLLIEEQRVNNYHIWNSTTDSSSSITPAYIDTQIVSSVLTPRGLPATAYTATKTGNINQYHGLGGGANSFSISSNTSISASAYIKDFNNSDYRLLFVISAYNVSTNNNRYLLYRARPLTGEWVGGAVHSSWTFTFNVKDVGNGWYRFEISGTNTYEAGWDRINFSFQLLNESNQQVYDPPTANTHGIYLSSPQYELGSFPTSYIPTNNANGTRTADNASITGSNFTEWYNQSGGTIVSSWRMPTIPSSTVSMISSFSDGTTNNRFMHYKSEFGANNLVRTSANGTAVNNGFGDIIFNALSKTAFSYETGTTITSYNGSPANVVSQSVPTSVNALYIGGSPSGITDGSVTFSQLTYYPTRLPNQVLQNLTK
jgi:hypothetical protein